MAPQTHSDIQQGLDLEFKKHDAQFERRAFRSDTEKVFKDLDEIRRKQIELASDHIAMETLGDITQVIGTGGKSKKSCSSSFLIRQTHQSMDGSTFNECQLNLVNFNKKGKALKKLIVKLDDLGDSV
ncbi:hypothetical protein [Absidia glauca]|uniref:Uncharacterized protein n=1 Tax=Absidia glauca TaxID=4829 RepID=A0A168MA62_ABSGL|nr:hypothetical protein [Absidia glauca]